MEMVRLLWITDALAAWKDCLTFHGYWLLPLHMALCLQYKCIHKTLVLHSYKLTVWTYVHERKGSFSGGGGWGGVEGSKNVTQGIDCVPSSEHYLCAAACR